MGCKNRLYDYSNNTSFEGGSMTISDKDLKIAMKLNERKKKRVMRIILNDNKRWKCKWCGTAHMEKVKRCVMCKKDCIVKAKKIMSVHGCSSYKEVKQNVE